MRTGIFWLRSLVPPIYIVSPQQRERYPNFNHRTAGTFSVNAKITSQELIFLVWKAANELLREDSAAVVLYRHKTIMKFWG